MIWKNYTVTGEDVNDVMVMENTAYVSYTIRLLYRFLYENGFSREKLKTLNLGIQQGNHGLVCYKNLMFTEPFLVEMNPFNFEDKINFKSVFFNSKNECCAEINGEVQWFDSILMEIVSTPKQILQHFTMKS